MNLLNVEPNSDRQPTRSILPIQVRFEQFHAANPQVWELFERFALQVCAKGRRFSARFILHRLVWETTIETTRAPEDEFKINDHYSSRYARLFAVRYPQYAHLVELRKLKKF